MSMISGLMRSTRAATAIEYGLIAALIFVAAAGAMSSVGKSTNAMWGRVDSTMDEALKKP